MKYYLFLSLIILVGLNTQAQKKDTVRVLLSTYKAAMSAPIDTLWHYRNERGYVILLHGTAGKPGTPVSQETFGYLLMDKRPIYEHVGKAVYYNW